MYISIRICKNDEPNTKYIQFLQVPIYIQMCNVASSLKKLAANGQRKPWSLASIQQLTIAAQCGSFGRAKLCRAQRVVAEC